MNEQILKALYEQGPKTIVDLAATLGHGVEELSETVADLIIAKQVHFEVDGTLWYAEETTE